MAELRGVLSLLIVFNIFTLILCSSRFVPVLIWQTPSLGNSLPSVSAVDKLSRSEFEADLTDISNSRGPIVFFLQDDLSVEDYTTWGNVYDQSRKKGAFENIKALLDNNNSSMLPAVESPKDSIPFIANGRSIFEIKDDSYPSPDKLENSLIIYRLPATDSVPERRKALSANDEIIGNFISKLSADSPTYTALYTSERSSWADAEEEHVRVSRSTLSVKDSADNETHYIFNVSDCYLLYFESLVIDTYTLNSDSTTYSVASEAISGPFTVESSCDEAKNTSLTLTVKYSNPAATNSPTLTLISMKFMKNKDNDWYNSNMSISVTYPNNTVLSNDLDVDSNFWAPIYYSYHCGSQTFMYDSYNLNTSFVTKVGVTFGNIQVQPFSAYQNGVFGDPFDCVGFFTIAIWMTIFIGIILIVTLGYGVNMIMNINTMDRFDDPKGKTITINAVE